MNEQIINKLEEQILSDIEALGDLKQYGSDERKQAVADLDKLYRLYLEDYKTGCETSDSSDRILEECKQHKIDNEFREMQLAREKKDKIIRYVIDGCAIVLPIGTSVFMLLEGFKFEETGTVTSNFFKWLINRQKLNK
ncbi:MAG: hypothetical protein K6E34_14850 [Lachnospiraceae bacterium]|nr:hypothetical protein [Lachnospiraceae bacterium]